MFISIFLIDFVLIPPDAEPPWIQCPENIVTQTNKHQGSSNVTLSAPVLRDNSGDEVSFIWLFLSRFVFGTFASPQIRR